MSIHHTLSGAANLNFLEIISWPPPTNWLDPPYKKKQSRPKYSRPSSFKGLVSFRKSGHPKWSNKNIRSLYANHRKGLTHRVTCVVSEAPPTSTPPWTTKCRTKKSSWWFQPIWKIWVKMGTFPTVRGENKKCLSCHHLEMLCSRCFQRHGPLLRATSTTRKTGCPKLKIPSLQLAVAEPLKPKRFWQAIVKKRGFNRWDGWKMLNRLVGW